MRNVIRKVQFMDEKTAVKAFDMIEGHAIRFGSAILIQSTLQENESLPRVMSICPGYTVTPTEFDLDQLSDQK